MTRQLTIAAHLVRTHGAEIAKCAGTIIALFLVIRLGIEALKGIAA